MTIDFTSCRRILHKAYNGANGKKIAIAYGDAVYMLKFPPSAEDKPTTLSYTNSCFSEHIGSRIFRLLGIDAQETLLGPDIVKRKTFFQGISFDEIPDFVGRRSLQAAMIDIYHFVEQSRHMKS